MVGVRKDELEGKVAIITGAGRMRSIGRQAALALAELGADLVLTGTGRDPSTFAADERRAGWRDIESVADEVRKLGRRALPLVVDVTDAAQVQRMVDATLREFRRIDILINNAAAPRGADRKPVAELEESEFRKVLDIKLIGTFLCCKAVIPALVKQGQGGKIVNLSSTAGKRAGANTAAYAAANFAINGFTQSLAPELGPHRVNVNAVCPGLIDTARNDPLGRGEAWQRNIKEIPIGRNGTPEEIGRFIAYLCTDAASFIHGACININGGQVMEH